MSEVYKSKGIRTTMDWRQRPVSPSKSVAALQQQWRSQLQETPVKRSSVRYPVQEEVVFDQEPIVTEETDRSNRSLTSLQSPSPTYASQESKVIKEGWLYRKNGLMPWKPVYGVAKHGNSIKPGGLYLYKDVKCAHHLQTYDMSEVVEIAPRAQDYKPGIKWEIRMLVKREDVILGMDDIVSRKDWVDSLTSIMGKVSMATQNELNARIQTSEQMNRHLQTVVETLEEENRRWADQCERLKEAIRTQEQNLAGAIKEALEKQEALFRIDCQTKEAEQRVAFDLAQNTLKNQCALLEREAKQWRTQCLEGDDSHARIPKEPLPAPDDTPLEALHQDVRQLARSLEEAKTGWKDLEHDILCFLETEKQDAVTHEAGRKHGLSLISQDLNSLREDLASEKHTALHEKLDLLLTRIVPPEPSRLDDTVLELIKHQEETAQEQTHQIKTIGHYLQLITNDIQNSAIPDLPALSQQLEEVLDRLEATEGRLAQAATPLPQPATEQPSHPHAQLEDIVRRAVKGASKLQMEQVVALHTQHTQAQQAVDTHLQRYEQNARTYFDRAMEKTHSDLHEFTGVMYEMLERLVLQALGDSPTQPLYTTDRSSSLEQEIQALQQEKESLKTTLQRTEQERHTLQITLDQHRNAFSTDFSHLLAKQLEPLTAQIQALKPLVCLPSPERPEPESERKGRFPLDHDRPTLTSPLVGARDRPRGKSPLANFLNRK
ncbi:hypothetical protein BY458DRAFT_560203 [Sporodiniella umbellata]|nr:hypothetical protein BY458DRAFT_560203 [Sporodiniella umbellata]